MESQNGNSTADLVDHLFRHESGRMVSVMTRLFGAHNLALAEDVVQEAFLKAFQELARQQQKSSFKSLSQ